MSCFNWVLVDCPNCGEEIEFQSKTGDRLMERYHITDVPQADVQGVMGESSECINCGTEVVIGDRRWQREDFSHLVRIKGDKYD